MSTLSPLVLAVTAAQPGSANRSPNVSNSHKYEGLCDRYIFQVISVDSSGVIEQDPGSFIAR